MRIIVFFCFILFACSCRQRYEIPNTLSNTGYLVVAGMVNSGAGPTTILLTRTTRMVDSFRIRYVNGAVVAIRGEDNSYHVLKQTTDGTYTAAQLNLQPTIKYKLYIKTQESKEYESDLVTIIKTPAIDKISWEYPGDLNIFVDTHDPNNKTHYYRWEFDQTWEFTAAYQTSIRYRTISQADNRKIVDYRFPSREPDLTMYRCWSGTPNYPINILSTAKLQKDTAHFRLVTIPRRSPQVSVLYSILVRQAALSKAGYEYMAKMKRNTESTGTIFDAQPSDLTGNIRCITNPSEQVIGFFDLSDVLEKRIFIKNSDLPNWGFTHGCQLKDLANTPESIALEAEPAPVDPAELAPNGDILKFHYTSSYSCIDCTLSGTNQKPSFWP